MNFSAAVIAASMKICIVIVPLEPLTGREVIAMDALDQLLVSCHDYFSPFQVSGYCYGRPGSTVGLLS